MIYWVVSIFVLYAIFLFITGHYLYFLFLILRINILSLHYLMITENVLILLFFAFDTHCFGNGPDNKVLRMAKWKAHLSPWISVYCNSVIQKSLLTYMVWRLHHFKKNETNQTTVMELHHFWMYIMIIYFNGIWNLTFVC